MRKVVYGLSARETNQPLRDGEEDYLSPRNLKILRQLRLMDDTFFAACFDNDPQLTEFVLRILIGKDDLHVTEARTQYTIKNMTGHSAVLDALAIDAQGRVYNIEVQRDNRGAVPERARYNGSLLDSRFFPKGEDYTNLPQTYVIFLTEHDVIGDNLGIYHIDRTVAETGKPFGDGSHVIYANASRSDDSALGQLMHDFMCSEPAAMYYAELSRKTGLYKEEDEGVRHMCQIIEDAIREERKVMFRKGLEQGLEQGRREERVKAAQSAERSAGRMWADGLSVERIVQYTGLPVETVRRIAGLSNE